METCGKWVSWWDGEYEGDCELPPNHPPPHYDGLSYYDDDGEQVYPPDATETDHSSPDA